MIEIQHSIRYHSGHKGVEAHLVTLTDTEFTRMADDSLIKYIPLTQGKFAIVDADDYEWLVKNRWYTDSSNRSKCYAKNNLSHARDIKKATAYMHRIITNAPKGFSVDHINHDTLDNRRCNLRMCTPAQNRYNEQKRIGFTSKYKGVSWNKRDKKWCVFIKINYKNTNLGSYYSELEAANVYNENALSLFGEFALVNKL